MRLTSRRMSGPWFVFAAFGLLAGTLMLFTSSQNGLDTRAGPEIEPAAHGAWLRPMAPQIRDMLQATFDQDIAERRRNTFSVAVMTAKGGSWTTNMQGEERRFWWASVGNSSPRFLS